MQIVIDISKEKYDEIMAMDWVNCRRFFDEEIRAIHDGKVLPAGHGRLIDGDKIGLSDFEIIMCEGNYKEALLMLIKKIDGASIIIEADKTESEG